MEVYEEYVVWDHEVLVGFYVCKRVKKLFDTICRTEGDRNGKVLAGLMRDYITMCQIQAEEEERQRKIAEENGTLEFFKRFGPAEPDEEESCDSLPS